MFRGKKYKDSVKLIESGKIYDPQDAIALITQMPKAKFDETAGPIVVLTTALFTY